MKNAVLGNSNVVNATPFALLDEGACIGIERDPSESTNAGAGYVWWGGEGFSTALDYFMPEGIAVDLIQLDIEGTEDMALIGAAVLISDHKPTIVIEEKPLPQGGDHLAARRLLESWGYKERARVHRDVIFTHG